MDVTDLNHASFSQVGRLDRDSSSNFAFSRRSGRSLRSAHDLAAGGLKPFLTSLSFGPVPTPSTVRHRAENPAASAFLTMNSVTSS